jgi:hypothetical protein
MAKQKVASVWDGITDSLTRTDWMQQARAHLRMARALRIFGYASWQRQITYASQARRRASQILQAQQAAALEAKMKPVLSKLNGIKVYDDLIAYSTYQKLGADR